MKTGTILSRSMIAAGLLAVSSMASATTITFDDTSLGGDNVFDFDSISLLSNTTTVTVEDTDGSGDLTGINEFIELSVTGTVSFNTESGTSQSAIQPSITGLNDEYQLFFDLVVTGTTSFGFSVDPFGNPQLAGIIRFDNTGTIDLYYDSNLASGLQQSDSTLLSSGGLLGSNGCSILSTSTVAVGNVLGSCLLSSEFNPIADVFFTSDSGVDLNSLIGITPLSLQYDINVDAFVPALQFVFPQGQGSSQTISVQHDGSVRVLVPEPASIAILGLGLMGLGLARRRA